jgi:hypothetical protein
MQGNYDSKNAIVGQVNFNSQSKSPNKSPVSEMKKEAKKDD